MVVKSSKRSKASANRVTRGKAAAKSSRLSRGARALGAAVGRTERAARDLSRATGQKKKVAKKTRAKAAAESRLTRFAVAVGTAIGRTERVARKAGKGARDTKEALEQKIALLTKDLAQARAEFKRAEARTSR